MANIQGGSDTANVVNVGATNTGAYAANVQTPTDSDVAGFATMSAEVDAGLVTGSRYVKELELTKDFRLRTGQDTLLMSHSFGGTVIARDKIQQNDTTMTCAQTNGQLTLNSGLSTTNGQATNIRTYRTFPFFLSTQTWFEWEMAEANPTATNVISEVGVGYCSGVTTQMTDGIIFRRTSGGQLYGVVINNSTDIVTTAITPTSVPGKDGAGTYDATETNHYTIAVHNDEVQWWINDILVLKAYVPAAYGSPSSACNLPFMARVNNVGGGAASAARTIALRGFTAQLGDFATNKPWAHQLAGSGAGADNVQPGTASASTVSRGATATFGHPNSGTARTAGTWTATSAPAINSLGGMYLTPAISTLTSDADYPVFTYLNPAGTATLPGKTLYITGIRVGESVVTTVASTNSIALMHIVLAGSSAAATSTADAAATRQGRVAVLGSHGFGASDAVGTMKNGYQVDFMGGPLIVPPGCYISFVVRPFGTVTSNTLVVSGSVCFIGYFE